MKKKLLTIIMVFIAFNFSFSQEFYGAPKKQSFPPNFSKIYDNDRLKGFVFVSFKEAASMKNTNYDVVFMDPDYKEVGKVTIKSENFLNLLSQVEFNGEILVLNWGSDFLFFDKTGKNIPVKKNNEKKYGLSTDCFIPVSKEGMILINYKDVSTSKARVHIDFYDNQGIIKWSVPLFKDEAKDKKRYEKFHVLHSNNSYLAGKVVRSKMTSREVIDFYFRVMSVENGDTIFEIPCVDNDFFYDISKAKFNSDTKSYILTGELYEYNPNDLSYPPYFSVKGLFQLEVDMAGKIVRKNTCQFTQQIKAQLVEKRPDCKGKNVVYKGLDYFENGNFLATAVFYEGINKRGEPRDSLKGKFIRGFKGIVFEIDGKTGKILHSQDETREDTIETAQLSMAGLKEEDLLHRLLTGFNSNDFLVNIITRFDSGEPNSCLLIEHEKAKHQWQISKYSSGGKIARDEIEDTDTEKESSRFLEGKPGSIGMITKTYDYLVKFRSITLDFK